MATLSITVPDAVVSRIKAAFGSTDPLTGVRSASSAQVVDAIKSYVKTTVQSYEAREAAKTTDAAIGQEAW
jgi:hypothetical protein